MIEHKALQSVSGEEYARIRQELMELKHQFAKSVPRTDYDAFLSMLTRINASHTIETRPHSLVLADITVTVMNHGSATKTSKWVFSEEGNLLGVSHDCQHDSRKAQE